MLHLNYAFIMQLELLPVLRGVLGATLAFSTIAILRLIPHINPEYVPHCWLIAFWSTLNAVLMTMLAVGLEGMYIFQILNTSSIFLIGGWAVLILRISTALRQTRGNNDV